MNKLTTFLKEVRIEMAKVSWPTKQQTINYTLVVLAISAVLMVYLGLLDFVFVYLLERFVLR